MLYTNDWKDQLFFSSSVKVTYKCMRLKQNQAFTCKTGLFGWVAAPTFTSSICQSLCKVWSQLEHNSFRSNKPTLWLPCYYWCSNVPNFIKTDQRERHLVIVYSNRRWLHIEAITENVCIQFFSPVWGQRSSGGTWEETKTDQTRTNVETILK